jgi:hypothetical protein
MIVLQKNETTGVYQKYEFDNQWPKDDDGSSTKSRCDFDQYWNGSNCNDCQQYYG